MKENKVKDFIKKYKVPVVLVGGVLTSAAIWAITRDKSSNYIDIPQPRLFTGEWAFLQRGINGKFTGSISGAAKAVDLKDLGNFGDALATIDGIDSNEPIRIIFATEKSFT
jgi:hypothetical protein